MKKIYSQQLKGRIKKIFKIVWQINRAGETVRMILKKNLNLVIKRKKQIKKILKKRLLKLKKSKKLKNLKRLKIKMMIRKKLKSNKNLLKKLM